MIDKTTLLILKKNIILASIVLFVPVTFSFAQSSQNSFSIEASPNTPQAYEEVILDLNSSSLNLDQATISWFLDGDLRLSGIGETSARFTTGPLGSASLVRVVVDTSGGGRHIQSISLKPANVDILWQAHSYTPPFYKGKALSPSSGLIILTAVPQLVDSGGKRLDPQELVYTWQEKGIVLGRASGFGKQSLILENGPVSQNPLVVSVTVSSFDESVTASQTLRVPIYSPTIYFYNKHPLEGILYERVVEDSIALVQDEITLRAEPFYFSLDDMINGFLRYRWRVNNRDINVPLSEQGNEITLRQEGGEGGALVSLEVLNDNLPFRVLQEAEKMLRLNIGL